MDRPAITPTILFILTLGILLLNSCNGGGGGTFSSDELEVELGLEGPGDAGNYIPLTEGNFWHYSGSVTNFNNYKNSASINFMHLVNGTWCYPLRESNSYGEGPPLERCLADDPNGIATLEADDGDPFLAQLAPYWEVRFPLTPGENFIQTDRINLDFEEDLDLDGINEKVDLRVTATVEAIESVSVPVGTFNNVVRFRRDLDMEVMLSSSRQKIPASGSETVWLAPGIGWVKRYSSIQVLGETESATEELDCYLVDGQDSGITLLTGVVNDEQVGTGQRSVYAFSTDPGQDVTVAMVGLTGDADLIPYLPDQYYPWRAGSDPESYKVTTTAGNRLIMAVENISGGDVGFSLTAAPTPSIPFPVSEGSHVEPIVITPDFPVAGQVQTRGTSYYKTAFPVAGRHSVTIFGLSGAAGMRANADSTYSFPLDCTPLISYTNDHCTLDSTDRFYFEVEAGPLNREGASYLILAH